MPRSQPDPVRFVLLTGTGAALFGLGIFLGTFLSTPAQGNDGVAEVEEIPAVVVDTAEVEYEEVPPVAVDTAEVEYLDLLILARTTKTGKMSELFDAIEQLPATPELNSFRFLDFAPGDGDNLIVMQCPEEGNVHHYCTGITGIR